MLWKNAAWSLEQASFGPGESLRDGLVEVEEGGIGPPGQVVLLDDADSARAGHTAWTVRLTWIEALSSTTTNGVPSVARARTKASRCSDVTVGSTESHQRERSGPSGSKAARMLSRRPGGFSYGIHLRWPGRVQLALTVGRG